MSLNIKAVMLTTALIWGGCFFVSALVNLAFPSYAVAWLQLAASIYPGYHGPGGLESVFIVTAYALADGAIAGAVFGWLYNRVVRRGASHAS